MEMSGLPEPIARIATRADMRDLVADNTIRVAAALAAPFVIPMPGQIILHPACANDPADGAVTMRHAVELSLLLRLWPANPVLAGFAAARTAALFATLEQPQPSSRQDPSHGVALTSNSPPDAACIAETWRSLMRYQTNAPQTVPPGTVALLQRVWPLLGPTEWLMQQGGDVRLSVDPLTGLNGYGCSHRPRPWAVTFASSTASSSSERGYRGAEDMRRQMLSDIVRDENAVAMALYKIRQSIEFQYKLGGGDIIALAPSGTDCELFALAIAQMHPADRPLTVVLVAPEETGTGVPLAAAGRHFAADTARGVTVQRGALVAGFRDDTEMAVVQLRNADGAVRSAASIAHDCDVIVDQAVAAGRRVVLHRVDTSKTGLLAPDFTVLQSIQKRHPDQIDIVVDACQARLCAARVGLYLAEGWMVLLTGSKFLTGPPFSGAVLIPAAMRDRLMDRALPAGLRDYSGRAEWPPGLPAAAGLVAGGNAGLALRWAAALAELQAFHAVADAQKHHTIVRFIARVGDAIASNEDLHLIDVPQPARARLDAVWDEIGTILSFAVRNPGAPGWLPPDGARQVYQWLNADLGRWLPAALAGGQTSVARRRFHVGQPAKLTLDGQEAGVLRISAGARLVSGEPSHASLQPQERLEREIADALAVLDKVSLIVRHWSALQDAAPLATYS